MLELTYYITHTESLRSKLAAQVKQLQKEVREGVLEGNAIKLLNCCTVATSFGARVEVSKLIKQIQVKEPISILRLFEDEYFLRQTPERYYIEALHPLRSEILAEELADEVLMPWRDTAIHALYCVTNKDVETFLLYSFSRNPKDSEFLLEHLPMYKSSDWSTIAGIARSLIWLGVRNYLNHNSAVIDSAREVDNSWPVFLNLEIAGLESAPAINRLLEILEKNNPSIAKQFFALNAQLSKPDTVYRFLIKWLGILTDIPQPSSVADWVGCAEIVYWLGRLAIKNKAVLESIELDQTFEHLPLKIFLDVLQGLMSAQPDRALEFSNKFLKTNIERFRRETNTIKLEESTLAAQIHFIVTLDCLDSITTSQQAQTLASELNDEAISRIRILQSIYHQKKVLIGTQGYGHKMILADSPDPTYKANVNNISFHPEWLVRVNSTLLNLCRYYERPDNWHTYICKIVKQREEIIDFLKLLTAEIEKYFAQKHYSPTRLSKIEQVAKSLAKNDCNLLLLPKLAADEWGFTSEYTKEDCNTETEDRFRKTRIKPVSKIYNRYKTFLKAANDYFYLFQKFIGDSLKLLVEKLPRKLKTTQSDAQLTVVNLFEIWKNTGNFQKEFRACFETMIDENQIRRLEKREQGTFYDAWALWYQFVNNPKESFDYAGSRAKSAIEDGLACLRKSILQSLSACSNRWGSRILNEQIAWDNKPTLWLSFELDNPNKMFEYFEELLSSLLEALWPVECRSLNKYIIDIFWRNIVIIPIVNGNNLDNLAWYIGSWEFQNEKKEVRFRQPIKIPQATMLQLGYPCPSCVLPPEFEHLETSFSKLHSIFLHLQCFNEIANSLDSIGKEILHQYLLTVGKKINRILGVARKSVSGVINNFRSHKHFFLNTESAMLLEMLKNCQQLLAFNVDGKPSHNFNIALSECLVFAEVFERFYCNLTVIKWKIATLSKKEEHEV